MRCYDVVIAGASFAGLACASRLVRRGLRVCVIERQPQPGHSVHTTGLLVREAAERLQLPQAFTRRIEGVRLYAPSLRHVDLDAPGYYFLATDTGATLRWLAEQAVAAGVELHCNLPFRSAEIESDRVVVNGGFCAARYLVGADGARSRVAAWCGLGRNRRFLRGIEAHFRGVHMPVDRLHCLLDAELAPGYIGWAFRGVDDVVQVGLACRRPHRPELAALLQRLQTLVGFRDAELVERRGGWIPIGGTVQPCARGRVLLVGDAAGVVSPLTAGGIHTAVESGERVADFIAARLLRCAAGRQRATAAAYPRFFWKRQLRWLADREWSNAWIEWAMRRLLLRRLAQQIFFYRRGLLGLSGWRALWRGRAALAEAPSDRRPAASDDIRDEHAPARALEFRDRQRAI